MVEVGLIVGIIAIVLALVAIVIGGLGLLSINSSQITKLKQLVDYYDISGNKLTFTKGFNVPRGTLVKIGNWRIYNTTTDDGLWFVRSLIDDGPAGAPQGSTGPSNNWFLMPPRRGIKEV